ncbi:pyruvate kinase [Candidatus Roizmanbacteria bacterium]|nr:pyruvate kinase [Candidatus Roizmanbacteria bacterium]
MKKLTKIIATIGPVTDSPEQIEALIHAGVNIFRFNFKHNTVEWHNERIERVNAVAERLGVSIGKLIDLQGPEIRIVMNREELDLQIDDKILFGKEALESSEKGFSLTHPEIVSHLKEGQHLVAEDGKFHFHVTFEGTTCYLISESAGILKDKKTLNIPGADFPFPVLIDRDLEGIQLAVRGEVDYVALSFVRSAEDIQILREEMKKYNLKAKVVAKIETQRAIHDLDAIVASSDAVMVARGDLGVELSLAEVPYYQKVIIRKCLEQGVPVITATQMLESMIENPYPTRAEVSDVANATYDLTDAVMLSGETATGKHPVQAVSVMAHTLKFNETKFPDDQRQHFHFQLEDQGSIICDAAYTIYVEMLKAGKKIKGFIIFSNSGRSVRLLSRYHALAPIYAFTPKKEVCESLSINFGVIPYAQETPQERCFIDEDYSRAIRFLKEKGEVESGDALIILHGDTWAVEGGISTVKVAEVV